MSHVIEVNCILMIAASLFFVSDCPAGELGGYKLLVTTVRTGDAEIFVVDAGRGDARNLTRSPASEEHYPMWSPDMKWISFRVTDTAYWRSEEEKEKAYKNKKPGKRPVWVMGADGSNPYVLEVLHYQCAIDGSRAAWKPKQPSKPESPAWHCMEVRQAMGIAKLLSLMVVANLSVVAHALGAESLKPICLHPENPHYLLFRGKPAVLITSGEHYGAVLNLDFDYVKYLDELQSHGLNLTRTFSGMYVEQWGPVWNTLNPAPNRYVCPWARSSTPGYADGGNKFDLSDWDANYFRRLKDFVSQAGKRGVVVELVLFCVFYDDAQWNLSPLNSRNNINGVGTKGRGAVYDESDPPMMEVQGKMVRKIVGELKGFDNVYFELCNEPYFADGPKLGAPWNDRIISAIRSVSKSHLIALNVANGSVRVEKMHHGVSIFNFHYSRPPDSVAMNYHHNKVIAFDETGFKGTGATNYRKYGWDFIIAGGAVYSNLDWSFTVDSEEGKSQSAADRLGPKDPALRPQLSYLKRFMDSLEFIRMRPRNDIVKGGIPAGATVRVLAEDGTAYALYINGGNKANLKLQMPRGTYAAEWLNPETGETEKAEKLTHKGGTVILSSPDYSEDIALRIKSLAPER